MGVAVVTGAELHGQLKVLKVKVYELELGLCLPPTCAYSIIVIVIGF